MITRIWNALIVPKDDRSRKLLTEVKDLNGKECSFRPMDTIFGKIYILMGVLSCTTEKHLLLDDMVLGGTRMTTWNNNTKLANHTDMVMVVLTGKHSVYIFLIFVTCLKNNFLIKQKCIVTSGFESSISTNHFMDGPHRK